MYMNLRPLWLCTQNSPFKKSLCIQETKSLVQQRATFGMITKGEVNRV